MKTSRRHHRAGGGAGSELQGGHIQVQACGEGSRDDADDTDGRTLIREIRQNALYTRLNPDTLRATIIQPLCELLFLFLPRPWSPCLQVAPVRRINSAGA